MKKIKFDLSNSEKEFKRLILKFQPEEVRFLKNNLDEAKAFKIIAALIEDSYNASHVLSDAESITISLVPRKKIKLNFPKTDTHFNKEKDRYQYHTLLAALEFCEGRNVAIDIGGHIGLYSHALVDLFTNVYAFEPSPINAECFKINVPKATLFEGGLGDREEILKLSIAPDNTGNSSLVEDFGFKTADVKIKTLDSMNFDKIDLVKIDVQGFEEQVLIGALESLRRFKPILIVEVITHKNMPPNQKIIDLLVGELGYKIKRIIGKDYIFG